MKTIYLSLFLVAISIFACKNNQSATKKVDQAELTGIYRGILPCLNCVGLQTEIKFDENNQFELLQKPINKDTAIISEYGNYEWTAKGKQILIKGKSGTAVNWHLSVGENQLVKLSDAGTNYPDDTANQYVLKKDQNADHRITGKYWKLIELNSQAVTFSDQQMREPFLILKNDNRTLSGHGGCNAIFGFYEILDGNRIKFGTIASTMMACMNVGDESAYFKIFEITDNYTVKEDTLSLNKARMAPLAKFKAIYLY